MSKRKWSDSEVLIRSIQGLLDSIEAYGGAIWFGKFKNKYFFLNQQLAGLINIIESGYLSYPIPNNKEVKQ